jgi:hypothetical protein
MNRTDLLATVERLCDTEISTLDRDELADLNAAGARVRAWLDAHDLRCARHGRTLSEAGRAESPAALIVHSSNRSGRQAHEIARRSAVADALPSFEDALHDATVSAGHLDAIANATRSAGPEVRAAFAAHEPELLAYATADTIDTFTRRCRSLVAQLTSELTDDDAAELDRQRAASNIRRWVNTTDGMHHTHAELDPVRDAIVWNAINRAVRSMQQRNGNARTPWNQLQADAFVAAVAGTPTDVTSAPDASTPAAAAPAAVATSGTAAPSSSPDHDDITAALAAAVDAAVSRSDAARARAHLGDAPASTDPPEPTDAPDSMSRRLDACVTEISVLVDLATLTGGLHDHSVCETEDGTALPVSTVRRLACDAEVIPIVLGGSGETLDVGRSRRTINRAQRRALRAMHRTCAEPDCTVPYSQCKIHHIRWWWRDRGPTDIDNLLPLCERHHHLVHEGGWGLTMTIDRVATWTRPDGTVHHHGSTIDRHSDNRWQPAADPSRVSRERHGRGVR